LRAAEKKRELLAEGAREDAEDVPVKWGGPLRLTWAAAQRADPELAKELGKPRQGFRVDPDGLLVKRVEGGHAPESWVPVVPSGHAAPHMTWKYWVFLQLHVGVFGMHRPADKTAALLRRLVWWEHLKRDVEHWTDRCLTCIRFRKRPTKQDMVPVKRVDVDCWQEIMVDCEGSSRPADTSGRCYVLTYLCLLCHGVLLEPMTNLTHGEVRRAFARCVFRSGALPRLLRSDRGPEFKNLLMQEFTALLGLRHRFGTPWRPVEQGAVERVHQVAQQMLGVLVHDVLQMSPEHWTEALPVLEFVIYNTPGPHGYTPRDIDRRWSLATPLEKELQPFQVLDFEPISEYAKKLFYEYRKIRHKVISGYGEMSEKRAELANRFRKTRELQPGMKVVYRDPRAKAAGGRTP